MQGRLVLLPLVSGRTQWQKKTPAAQCTQRPSDGVFSFLAELLGFQGADLTFMCKA